jgi:hypothetical protein
MDLHISPNLTSAKIATATIPDPPKTKAAVLDYILPLLCPQEQQNKVKNESK